MWNRFRNFALVGLSIVALPAGCGTSDPDLSRSVGMDTVSVLRFDSLSGPTRTANVAIAAEGSKVAVSPDRGSGEIYLFENGILVARYNAPGSGPHELARVQDMTFGSADSLFVLDSDNQKLLVLSPELQFVRGVSLNGSLTKLAATRDGSIYLAGASSDGVTLSRLDATGDLVEVRSVRGGGAGPPGPALLAAAERHMWFGSGHRYTLAAVDFSGAVVGELSRSPSWWGVKPENADAFEDLIGTGTRLLGVATTSDLVWTIAGVPPEQYPEGDPMQLDFTEPAVVNQLGDHVLEALDPESHDAIAQLRLDELNSTILPGGFLWRLEMAPNGEPRILLVKLRVE